MENNIVKAFRQRLNRGGFSDISIYSQFDGTYLVYFRDSSGKLYKRVITESQMECTLLLVWFD